LKIDINTLLSLFHCITNNTEQHNQNQTTIEHEALSKTQIKLRESHIPFNELVIEKEIGEGSYGRVCFATWNSAPVALKFCRKKTKLDEFVQEMKLMM
jgi:hypothetical protein